MFKKIYYFIKSNFGFLIFLLCLYTFINYELPYVIYTPGSSINMDSRVDGDNIYDSEGSFHMTYVSMVRGSLPFLGLSYIIPNWDIVPKSNVTYDKESLKETLEIDKIYMREAISNAEYVAYENAAIDFEILKTDIVVTYVSKDANTNLKHGDIVLDIDGQYLSTLKELQTYIETKKPKDKIKIRYDRKGKTVVEEVELIELEGLPRVGISIANISEYKTDYNIEVKTKSSESGPSGGFMTALEIYNKITETDITKGLTIMGTGTIDKDGSVGEIGGVKYKLIGAVKNKADIFICPKENYKEAIEAKERNNYDIKVLGVSTFKEALELLEKVV